MEAGKNIKIKRSNNPVLFFSAREKEHIKQAVIAAEKETSGEFRVHVAKSVKEDIMKETALVFERIGMTKTKLRNGVLVFFAVKNKRFAILGDSGIHKKMGDKSWKKITEEMQEYFKKDDFAGGIAFGIEKIGKTLKKHFPYKSDDVNELPDDISYEK